MSLISSALACGGRYELGQTRTNLLDEPLVSADQIGVLIIDGPEDADAATDLGIVRGLGDIDGDGHGDLLVGGGGTLPPSGLDLLTETNATGYGYSIFYGAPRSSDGFLRDMADGANMEPIHAVEAGDNMLGWSGGGDTDGDGREDVLTAGELISYYDFDLGRGLTRAESLWTQQGARLIYGVGRRADGEAHGARLNPAPRAFPREQALGLATHFAGYYAIQGLGLTPLGDIDRDGFDDVALRAEFGLMGREEDEHGNTTNEVSIEDDVSLYVFYGSPERFETNSPLNRPAAQLSNVSDLDPIGDIDGDGQVDFVASWGSRRSAPRTATLVTGTPARFAGTLDFDTAIPIEGATGGARSVGDLDGDGYDDFVVFASDEDQNTTLYLFYGEPALLRQALDVRFAEASFQAQAVSGAERAAVARFVELTPVGDWNGDGLSDLLLWYAASDTVMSKGEARIIPGTTERYAGRYTTPTLLHSAERALAFNFRAIGDVDGDGLIDIAFTAMDDDGERGRYIKYGGPLSADIH